MLEVNPLFFCISESKNCKNWVKYTYSVPMELDYQFLDFLKEIGKVEILDFSKFSKSSKIFYKMNFNHILTVEGVLFENTFIVTHSKKNLETYEQWQTKFKEWCTKNGYPVA